MTFGQSGGLAEPPFPRELDENESACLIHRVTERLSCTEVLWKVGAGSLAAASGEVSGSCSDRWTSQKYFFKS